MPHPARSAVLWRCFLEAVPHARICPLCSPPVAWPPVPPLHPPGHEKMRGQGRQTFAQAGIGAALAAMALGLGVAACGEPPPDPQAEAAVEAGQPSSLHRRGLWVLCEGSQRLLDHPEKIPQLLEDARALGVTDLFVQVYRGGRAWFDSSLADSSPWQQVQERTGQDTLAALLPEAHAAGLRVHAWVNVLSLASNTDAPLLRDLGPDAVLVDQAGRSLLDYPELDVPQPDRRYYRMGTPAVWLDPAAPGVAPRLAETFAELAARYRDLDGIHLDYIRYPGVLPFAPGSRFGVGLDLGHGAKTRARFREETGLSPPRPPDQLGNANRWDEWRREKVTELVRSIRDASRLVKPDIEISAAVWAFADRAYLSIGQDWRRWLEEGLIEFAVPMAYTLDDRLFRYHAEAYTGDPQRERIWPGIGAWLFSKRPEGAVDQVQTTRDVGLPGDALFSWDSIVDAPALRDALVADAAQHGIPSAAEAAPAPAEDPHGE